VAVGIELTEVVSKGCLKRNARLACISHNYFLLNRALRSGANSILESERNPLLRRVLELVSTCNIKARRITEDSFVLCGLLSEPQLVSASNH